MYRQFFYFDGCNLLLDVYRLGIILSKYLSPKKNKVNLCFVVNSYLGTPVYSMYDGVVVKVEDWIKSVINDEYSIVITYAHLQSGNAIGYNYRSGRTFEVGDKVYQGELIGYSGRSGNAYNVPNKHVHIAVRKEGNSKWIDPALYINGKIDVDTINENKGRIADIKCDD